MFSISQCLRMRSVSGDLTSHASLTAKPRIRKPISAIVEPFIVPLPSFFALPVNSRGRKVLRTTGADIGKYARHRRQATNVPVDHAEQRDDRGLVCGDAVEIAHGQ